MDSQTIRDRSVVLAFVTLLMLSFTALTVNILTTDPLWINRPLPWAVVSYLICAVSVVVILLRTGVHAGKLLCVASMSWLVFLFLISSFKVDVLCFAALALYSLLLGVSGRFLLQQWAPDLPVWAGFLFMNIFLHHIFMFLSLIGKFFSPMVVFVLFASVLPGVFGLLKDYKNEFIGSVTKTIRSVEHVHVVLIFTTLLLLTCSFSAASLPQSYTDGVVYRLPFLRSLALQGALPFHHYLWAWLVPQTFNIQVAPAYLFLGEQGASWSVFLMLITLVLISFDFVFLLTKSKLSALFCCVLLVSHPIIWVLSTAVYNDLHICGYVAGGFYLFTKGILEKKVTFYLLSTLLFSFACSFKLNAPLQVAIIVSVSILATVQRFQFFNLKNAVFIVFGFLFIALPWFIWVYVKTGNPFFPYLANLFDSQYTPSIMTEAALQQYGLTYSLSSFLTIPWNIVFETSRYGGYLNGTFGPSIFILLPLVIYRICCLIYFRNLPNLKERLEIAYIISYAIVFLVITLMVKMTVFRYTLPAFIVFLIASVSFITPLFSNVRSLALATSASYFSIFFLVLIGSHINWAGGLGVDVFIGNKSRIRYINELTHGVDTFVNSRTKHSESVLATSFFQHNRIDTHTFLVSKEDSLFGMVSDLDKIESFIEENQVKFWIVNTADIPDYLIKNGIAEKFFSLRRAVYGNGSLAVYDVRSTLNSESTAETYHIKSWFQGSKSYQFKESIEANPDTHAYAILEAIPGIKFLKGEIVLGHEVSGATAIVDIIFKDEKGSELSREVSSASLVGESSKFQFFASIPTGTHQVQLIARPWRVSDGKIFLMNAISSLPQVR